MKIEDLEKKGLILLKILRGSHMYGLNTESSDEDFAYVYIAPLNDLLGLNYRDQFEEDKGNIVCYELTRFMQLLLKSNPTTLEIVYAPESSIIYKHPLFDEIIKNKEVFLTKKIKNALIGYGIEQLKKSRGQNKYINLKKDSVKRKTPLDFIYTTYKQGSQKITKWLKDKGLKQEYCGLTNIPNMEGCHHLYYDYMQHAQRENLSYQDFGNLTKDNYPFLWYKFVHDETLYHEFIKSGKNFKYKGLIKDLEKSNDISLSSIPKGEFPVILIQYRKDSYTQHCKKYKEFKIWEQERNESRFTDNRKHGQNYDSKNIMHTARLLNTAKELFTTGEFNVFRKDREYLLSIRKGEYDLEEILKKYEAMIPEIDEIFKTSVLPDDVDKNFVNELIIKMRKEFYGLS